MSEASVKARLRDIRRRRHRARELAPHRPGVQAPPHSPQNCLPLGPKCRALTLHFFLPFNPIILRTVSNSQGILILNHNSKTSCLKGSFDLLMNQRKQHKMTMKGQERQTGVILSNSRPGRWCKPSPCLTGCARPSMREGWCPKGSTVLPGFCVMRGKLPLPAAAGPHTCISKI